MKNVINLINSQTTQDYHCVYREHFDDGIFYLTKALYGHIDEDDQNSFVNIDNKLPSPNLFW